MAMERKTKAATETGLYLVILLAIVVVVNVLSHGCGSINGVYSRMDATKAERFTLSKGSGRLLHSLKQPLVVDAYVTRGTAKLNAFVRDFEDLLKEYERAGGGKFRFRIIEAKSDDEKKEAKDAGLSAAAFGEGSETGADQAVISQGYMGVVFKYGSEKDVIPILSPDRTEGLEFWITNKIRGLRDKADNIKYEVGVLTSEGGINLDEPLVAGPKGQTPSMKAVMKRALPFYDFVDVDLKGGESVVPDNLAGLIITQPGKALSDKELRRIDEFVMKGKSLVVFAGAANMKPSDPQMRAELNLHNLDKLLSGYGIEMSKDVLLDWGLMMQVGVQTQTGQLAIVRAPGIVHLQHFAGVPAEQQVLDDAFPSFFRLPELTLPYPSTLKLLPEKQPDAQLAVVGRTSPNTSSHTEALDLRPSQELKPLQPLEQRPVAAYVQGKLKSAMGTGDGIDVPASSTGDARVLVIASPQFLGNPFARAGQGPDLGPQFAMMGNVGGDEQLQLISQYYAKDFLTSAILSFKNTLDWMAGDSDLIAVSAKILGDPNLNYASIGAPKLPANPDEDAVKKELERIKGERQKTQSRVQWTLTLLLPLLFAAFGIVRWQMRERSRANITLD